MSTRAFKNSKNVGSSSLVYLKCFSIEALVNGEFRNVLLLNGTALLRLKVAYFLVKKGLYQTVDATYKRGQKICFASSR